MIYEQTTDKLVRTIEAGLFAVCVEGNVTSIFIPKLVISVTAIVGALENVIIPSIVKTAVLFAIAEILVTVFPQVLTGINAII